MVDPCNSDQKDCSMSTEFPEHNIMESSIDYSDRMQISVGNDTEGNALVTTEVNDICTGNESKSRNKGIEYPAVVKVSKTANDNELSDGDDDNGSDLMGNGDREVNSVLNEGFIADSKERSCSESENSASIPVFTADGRPAAGEGALNSVKNGTNSGDNEDTKDDGTEDTVSSILFSLNSVDMADIEENGEDEKNI